MIDQSQSLIDLSFEEHKDRLQSMPRAEVVNLARILEAVNERLKNQLSNMDPGEEPHQKKERYRGFILGKLRLCNDRLTEMKNEVTTVGVFFRRDEDGFPDYYLKAAQLTPGQYKEALLRAYGSKCPPMIASYKVAPDAVPADQWDDIPSEYEPLHEHFSR